jgi:hypothetical protein
MIPVEKSCNTLYKRMHKFHTRGKADCIAAGKNVIITCPYPSLSFHMDILAKIKFWYKILYEHSHNEYTLQSEQNIQPYIFTVSFI